MVRRVLANVARGLAMGAADVVPGVSGGTVALLLGIYDRLVGQIAQLSAAAAQVLRGRLRLGMAMIWRAEWRFLAALLAGIGIAIVALVEVVRWLIDEQPVGLSAAFFGLVAEGSSLVRVGILDEAVHLFTLVVFGQVFRNRHTFFVHEQQAVTILVDLHIVAGADPSAVLDLFGLVRVEPARAQRASYFIYILREPKYYGLGHSLHRRRVTTRLLGEVLNEPTHTLHSFFTRLFRHPSPPDSFI